MECYLSQKLRFVFMTSSQDSIKSDRDFITSDQDFHDERSRFS